MPRMETERVESTTITVRVPESLKDSYVEALGGKNQSTDLRQHMESVANVSDTGHGLDDLPEDKALRESYLVLDRYSDPVTNQVPTDVALSSIANETNTPKKIVRRSILKPLERMGFIEPNWGYVRVLEVASDD